MFYLYKTINIELKISPRSHSRHRANPCLYTILVVIVNPCSLLIIKGKTPCHPQFLRSNAF